jgi:hypothetical protein
LATIADLFWKMQDPETGEWVPDLDSARFITGPLEDPTDEVKRFGETYTIVWIVPGNIEAAVAALMQHVAELVTGESSLPAELDFIRGLRVSMSDRKERPLIGAYELWHIWRQFVDRAFFYGPHLRAEALTVREGEITFLDGKIIDEFKRQLSALPNGPTSEDWDELDELLAK